MHQHLNKGPSLSTIQSRVGDVNWLMMPVWCMLEGECHEYLVLNQTQILISSAVKHMTTLVWYYYSPFWTTHKCLSTEHKEKIRGIALTSELGE